MKARYFLYNGGTYRRTYARFDSGAVGVTDYRFDYRRMCWVELAEKAFKHAREITDLSAVPVEVEQNVFQTGKGLKRGKRRVSRPLNGVGTSTVSANVGPSGYVKCVYKRRSI